MLMLPLRADKHVLGASNICMLGADSHKFALYFRKQSQQLAEHMAAGQTEAAIALLVANPQLAWLKDGQTGNYPIHTACKLVRPPHVDASGAHVYGASAGQMIVMATND